MPSGQQDRGDVAGRRGLRSAAQATLLISGPAGPAANRAGQAAGWSRLDGRKAGRDLGNVP
ncbi:MAG TPA: hypothetical protein VFQ44_30690 [Streptosporangiaceae bacterium]|nr:hypothetical protein [Streptosporangiaceae bacterium]